MERRAHVTAVDGGFRGRGGSRRHVRERPPSIDAVVHVCVDEAALVAQPLVETGPAEWDERGEALIREAIFALQARVHFVGGTGRIVLVAPTVGFTDGARDLTPYSMAVEGVRRVGEVGRRASGDRTGSPSTASSLRRPRSSPTSSRPRPSTVRRSCLSPRRRRRRRRGDRAVRRLRLGGIARSDHRRRRRFGDGAVGQRAHGSKRDRHQHQHRRGRRPRRSDRVRERQRPRDGCNSPRERTATWSTRSKQVVDSGTWVECDVTDRQAVRQRGR